MDLKDTQYKNGYLVCTPPCGMSVVQAIQNAHKLAEEEGYPVFMSVNDVTLCVNKNTDLEKMYQSYCEQIKLNNIHPPKRAIILRVPVLQKNSYQKTIG